MKDLVKKKGIEGKFYIASAATSTEEIGNPVYPPARRKLAQVGIRTDGKTARQMTMQDYDKFDYLIGMEDVNVRNMLRITGGDPGRKIGRLLDYTGRPGNIADPWYTGNFDETYNDVLKGCESLIEYLKKEGKIV